MAGVAMMVRDKYAVRLAQEQREELQRLIRVGKNSARVTARARILLKSDDGWAAPQVAEALDVALSTVYRVKQRFAEEGLERVLQDRPQANRPRKLDDRGEVDISLAPDTKLGAYDIIVELANGSRIVKTSGYSLEKA